MFGIDKVRDNVKERLEQTDAPLYIKFAYPVLFAFTLIFVVARLLAYYVPDLFVNINGVHVHHFAFGIIVLAIAGYLGLYLHDEEELFWLSLFYGFGLGLAFDEFGMWLRLDDSDPIRWGYDGATIVISALLLIIFAKPGWKLVKRILKKKNFPQEP